MIKLSNTRLNFVMSIPGISDDVSLSYSQIIDLDNDAEFPDLPTVTTDPIY